MAWGDEWSFQEFCEVFCSPDEDTVALARRLGRLDGRGEAGAIVAARAAIAAALAEESPTFTERKWADFVRRAQAGECRCSERARQDEREG